MRNQKQWAAVEPGYDGPVEEWTVDKTNKNLEALNFVIENVKDRYSPEIMHVTTVREVWLRLQRQNCECTWTHIAVLLRELANTTKTDDTSMQEYRKKFENLILKLKIVGVNYGKPAQMGLS